MIDVKPWREISDMVHLRPRDFAGTWFLPLAHVRTASALQHPKATSASSPSLPSDDELIQRAVAPVIASAPLVVRLAAPLRLAPRELSVDEGEALAAAGASWDFARKFIFVDPESTERGERGAAGKAPRRVRDAFAAAASLDVRIWWHEELSGAVTNESLLAAVRGGAIPETLDAGCLLQRLLHYDRIADGAEAATTISIETARALCDALTPVAEEKLAALSSSNNGGPGGLTWARSCWNIWTSV